MSKPFAPAAERNRQPILDVLRHHLPATGVVLEIASGTGQHAAFFAGSMPSLTWLPSEKDSVQVNRLTEGLEGLELANLCSPRVIDVADRWPNLLVDAVVTANLLHISPPETVAQLCFGASQVCRSQGVLHVYGPFKRGGVHTSDGNSAFDEDLRQRNPAWGIRDMEAVVGEAERSGFGLVDAISQPANNFSLVFVRQ